MKFEDIRITAKTGGGREMTLKHMFQGMAPTIKEIAGEDQGSGVTEQRVNELVGAAVDQVQITVGENATAIGALQTSVSGLTQAVEDAQQELIAVKQQNAALEARLAALEAGANAN